jgi:hypothetical protein
MQAMLLLHSIMQHAQADADARQQPQRDAAAAEALLLDLEDTFNLQLNRAARCGMLAGVTADAAAAFDDADAEAVQVAPGDAAAAAAAAADQSSSNSELVVLDGAALVRLALLQVQQAKQSSTADSTWQASNAVWKLHLWWGE